MTGLGDVLPLLLAGLVALAGGGLWFGGRAKGKADAARKAAERRTEAMREKEKADEEASQRSDDGLRSRLTRRD